MLTFQVVSTSPSIDTDPQLDTTTNAASTEPQRGVAALTTSSKSRVDHSNVFFGL